MKWRRGVSLAGFYNKIIKDNFSNSNVENTEGGSQADLENSDNSQLTLHSDCNSFNFMPVGPNGNYQSCGVKGLYFTWFYAYEDNAGKLNIGYAEYKFNLLYFEFPRKRMGKRTIISGGAAATTICALIDFTNMGLELTPLSNRNPATYKLENETLLLNLLKNVIQPLGGRVTKESNYGMVPISRFRKSVWANICL